MATVSITVAPTNHPPVAVNDSYSVGQGQTLNISAPGVLSNDTDSDGDALTAVRVSSPSHGTLTLNPNGSFTYSHDGSATQTDSFAYTARDPSGATSNVATVSITVSPVNHPPVAANDSYSVGQGQTMNVPAPGVLRNDTDADGDALTAVRVSSPSHGTLTLNSNGSFSYSNDGSGTQSDSFTYTARDPSGATSNVATVSITVSPVNHPPVAVNDSYSVSQGQTLNFPAPGVLRNDTDADGDALTAVRVSSPSHGTLTLNSNGSFSYSNDGSGTQSDSFTYTARDPSGATSNVATVSITVSPINHPPVARNDTYNMGLLDVILTVPAPGVLANDTDADGDALTAALVTGPSRGTLVFDSSGSLVYTPLPSLSSFTDTFAYRANDGAANSNIATVTIQVTRGL